jgi:hypothetical protein
MTVCPERAHVDRHFEGSIDPEAERTMRDHMPGCDACRAYYGRRLLLAELDPASLPARERIAQGLGLRRPLRGARVLAFGALPVLAAAAALLLWWRAAPDPALGFAARGGVQREAASRVFVYDVRPGSAPSLAGGSVGRHEELAFAYENGAAKNRVMIFGVDEHRHVYWFYPAWTNEADDPVAVPIATDGRRHELPDAVRHDFDGVRLDIHALFVDRPVSVRQVEALVRARPDGDVASLGAVPGAVEDHASFTLAP